MKTILLAMLLLGAGAAALAMPTTAACTVSLDDPSTVWFCLGPPLEYLKLVLCTATGVCA